MSENLSLEQVRAQIKDLKEQIRVSQESQAERIPSPFLQFTEPPTRQLKLSLRKTLKGHYGKVYAMHWGKDHQSILSASQDSKLIVWNVETQNKRLAIPLEESWVMTCAFSPDETILASGGLDNICTLFKIGPETTGWQPDTKWKELRGHEGYLSGSKFVSNHSIITSSGDSSCILWDIESGKASYSFQGHQGDVADISIWEPNTTFVSASCDGFCKIWDYRDRQCVANFGGQKSDVNCVQWFPNSKSFASGSDDAIVRLFDVRAYREVNSYSDEAILNAVTKIDFSKCGGHLFVGYEEEPYILAWDTIRCNVIQQFKQFDTRVACVNVSPDGYGLATGSWDTFIRVWA